MVLRGVSKNKVRLKILHHRIKRTSLSAGGRLIVAAPRSLCPGINRLNQSACIKARLLSRAGELEERINHEYAVVFSRSKVLKKPETAPTTAGAIRILLPLMVRPAADPSASLSASFDDHPFGLADTGTRDFTAFFQRFHDELLVHCRWCRFWYFPVLLWDEAGLVHFD